jgi:hypothetical protein
MSLVPYLNNVYPHNNLNTPGFIYVNWLLQTPTRPSFMTTTLLVIRSASLYDNFPNLKFPPKLHFLITLIGWLQILKYPDTSKV